MEKIGNWAGFICWFRRSSERWRRRPAEATPRAFWVAMRSAVLCGVVAEGDVGISGNAKLDGFFTAVADLNKAQVAINGDFAANIDSLCATFGAEVAANATIDAKVDALIAKVKGEISANADGGLVISYVGPKCEANVNVAFEAQAQCEAKADW